MTEPSRPGTPEPPSRLRAALSSNLFRAGVVVLSAAIIFGAWALSDARRDETPDGPEIELSLDDLYEQARRAAESGEDDEAIAILERILAEDPGNERARRLLDSLTGQDGGEGNTVPDDGDAGTPDGGSPPGGTSPPEEPVEPEPRDDSAYLAPASDLRSLLPEIIGGWTRGTLVSDGTDATVPFSPNTAGDLSRLLYSVHDMGSPEAALDFIEGTSKVAYPHSGAVVPVGVVEGYFGTDGSRLATVAFARGRFAFEVVVTVLDGDPSTHKDAVRFLAREFEATK